MVKVFDNAEEVVAFLNRDNKVVENWVNANWGRVDGMTGGVDKSRISRVLSGQPVADHLVDALELMYQEMRADPWEWCKPPDVDALVDDRRALSWWYETLKPPIPWTRFERARQFPLGDDDRALLAQLLADWSSRLRAACDRFKADTRLVRALESDMNPAYQDWVKEDRWVEVGARLKAQWSGEKRRMRVGSSGLHGMTPEEIGLAYALKDAIRPLPDVQSARLAYAQPRVVPETEHLTEAVEKWNGDEFESWETRIAWMGRCVAVRHDVIRYWDGERYAVEDVRPFALISDDDLSEDSDKEGLGHWTDGQFSWREATQDERDILRTGMKREHLTREEFEERHPRDEFIENVVSQTGEHLTGMAAIMFQPETREGAAAQYEARLGSIDESKALDERRELAQRLMRFRLLLRRR